MERSVPKSIVIVGNGYRAASGDTATPDREISWTRKELDLLLRVYGRQVAAGEWRDYAIDMLRDRAAFSIFRRSAEMPLYRVEKRPALAAKQGANCVISMSGAILKRGHDLAQVLKVLEKKKDTFRLIGA